MTPPVFTDGPIPHGYVAPGPWLPKIEARPAPSRGHWYIVLDDEENAVGEFYGDDHDSNIANVKMAAAAPDLYAALCKLTLMARTSGGTVGPDSGLMNACANAEDVLAKSRGEVA